MKRILIWLFPGLLLKVFGGTLIYLCFLKFEVFTLALGIGLFAGGICCIAMLGAGRPISNPPLDVPFHLLYQRQTGKGIIMLLASEKSVRFFRVNSEQIVLYDKDNKATNYDKGEWPERFSFFRPKKSLSEKLHVLPTGSDLYTVIYSKE